MQDQRGEPEILLTGYWRVSGAVHGEAEQGRIIISLTRHLIADLKAATPSHPAALGSRAVLTHFALDKPACLGGM